MRKEIQIMKAIFNNLWELSWEIFSRMQITIFYYVRVFHQDYYNVFSIIFENYAICELIIHCFITACLQPLLPD